MKFAQVGEAPGQVKKSMPASEDQQKQQWLQSLSCDVAGGFGEMKVKAALLSQVKSATVSVPPEKERPKTDAASVRRPGMYGLVGPVH